MLIWGNFRVGCHLQGEINAVVVTLVHLTALCCVFFAHEILQLEDAYATLILNLADLSLRQDLQHLDLGISRNEDLLDP